MKRKALGGAYLRRRNGDPAGERQWQRYRAQPGDVHPEDRDRIGQLLDDDPAGGAASASDAAPSRSGSGAGRALLMVVLIVGAVVAVRAAAGDDDGTPDDLDYAPIVDAATWDRVVAAVEETTGTTEVVRLSLVRDRLYDDGALSITLDAPPTADQPLQVGYEWDGSDLVVLDGREHVEQEALVDLAEIDPAVLVDVDQTAWEQLDDDVSSARISLRYDDYADRVEVEATLYDGDDFRSLRADVDGTVLESEIDD